MHHFLNFLWALLQGIVGFNLVYPGVLRLLNSLKPTCRIADSRIQPDYAVIITAYEFTDTLMETVQSALQMNYQNYLIYLVADNCDVTRLNLDSDRVILLRPEVVLRSNVKSHFYAIDRFVRPHELITILDSDNLVHPEFLNNLNPYFEQGFEAVQGLREARNLDTTFACLDAARDIYYHCYDCKLLFNLGSSSTLSGSGMAFKTSLYQDCLYTNKVIGAGFDKILQAEIIGRDKRIAFAPKAIVYDTKTSRSTQLVNQRARWINTWFKYFKFGFKLISKGLIRLSINQLLFGITLLRPPLFLFLLLSLILMAINMLLFSWVGLLWLLGFSIFLACFFGALISSNPDRRIYKSLVDIPKFVFYQILSLSKIRKANLRSVSTRHYNS